MAGTIHSDSYQDFLRALVAQRGDVGFSQAQLAARLGKPPSFVGKYELGERRLDIIELLVILRELDTDFTGFWGRAEIELPNVL
ncbi:MAG: helix-turn-helix transcriptional regulator [Litoreibacter sp.]